MKFKNFVVNLVNPLSIMRRWAESKFRRRITYSSAKHDTWYKGRLKIYEVSPFELCCEKRWEAVEGG